MKASPRFGASVGAGRCASRWGKSCEVACGVIGGEPFDQFPGGLSYLLGRAHIPRAAL